MNLEQFGRGVLDILEQSKEWNADTLNAIADLALILGLAKVTNAADWTSNVKEAPDGEA